MPPVLELKLSEKTLTSSNLNDEWYSCFDRNELFAAKQSFRFPEFDTILVGLDDWKWPSQKVKTVRIIETEYVYATDLIEEIESPLLPPRNRFRIKLNIKNIKRGHPSTCDEVEL